MFFICHSPEGDLAHHSTENLHLWIRDRLADMAVRVGLHDWLVERVA